MQALDALILKDETMKGLDARRFRANIISAPTLIPCLAPKTRRLTPLCLVSGSEEFEEETWKVINLKHPSSGNECQFDVACRTVR